MDLSTVQLNTPRLHLRPLHAGDDAALFALHRDPLVMRYWSHLPWTQISQARERIAQDQLDLAAGAHLRLALVPQGGDQLIGTVCVFSFMPTCRRAEIGYALRTEQQGQGLMHEALNAVVSWVFDELKLNRLEADIDPRNLASARSLERLGFECEGLLRERWIVGDEVSDSALYGLLLSRWTARPTLPLD
jgi:RimJ/RimL family protein N-acetyltransferase